MHHWIYLIVLLFFSSGIEAVQKNLLICCSRPAHDTQEVLLERFGQNRTLCRVLDCVSSSDDLVAQDLLGIHVQRCLGDIEVEEGVIFAEIHEKPPKNKFFYERFDRHLSVRIQGYAIPPNSRQFEEPGNTRSIHYRLAMSPRFASNYRDIAFLCASLAVYYQLYAYLFGLN